MAQLNPYISFSGNCREAMEFYQACLGGELSIMTVGESPAKEQLPAQTHQNVLHSRLKNGGIELMAADMMSPGEESRGNDITLCISAVTKEEAQKLYTKLAEGGAAGHPLEEVFFGYFGDLTDKFGIHWMIQADNA